MLYKIVDRLKTKLFFKALYFLARIGLALTFIISGLRKLPGVKFTSLPETNPVGAYFAAMHD